MAVAAYSVILVSHDDAGELGVGVWGGGGEGGGPGQGGGAVILTRFKESMCHNPLPFLPFYKMS